MKTKPESLNEISDAFFKSSSEAALTMFTKTGEIPMALSALVKNGKEFELIPIGDESISKAHPKLAQTMLDTVIKPLVDYVNENKKSRPIAFFFSVIADGVIINDLNGAQEKAQMIITAARNENGEGKTNTFKVNNNHVFIILDENDSWVAKAEANDVPATLAQGLLDMLWKTYIVAHNMSTLK